MRNLYEVEETYSVNFAATGVDEILQNVAFIMSTTKFSCPLDRDFGWNSGIDEPMHIRKAKYINELTEALMTFEPRVIVVSVNFLEEPLKGVLKPKVKVIINDESI